MYTEFIIIFVLLGIVALLLLTVLILQCVILKKLSSGKKKAAQQPSASVYAIGRGTAICRNCATQFAANEKVCPKCGTTR